MSAFVEPLRIVLLADGSDWAHVLREQLAALNTPSSLITAPSWEAASSLFDDPHHSLLLATAARQPAPGHCPLPVVLLLDEEPDEAPVGVSDWLVRAGFGLDMLRRCLRHVREQTLLKSTLQRLAEQDPLTGIANRQAGDRLILQVVARLQAQLAPGDQLARLGSDEFALLLDTRADPQRAERMGERLTEALSEPYLVDGESLLLGCSLGLAHARTGAGADPLMWHAHIAMQQAKSVQGCTFHIYDERINRSARSLADLEGELRQALRRDELELHYQPRLSLADGRIVGLEALVRWRHGERGLLGPDEFIPLAEQSGLIVPLGYWVMARALRDMQWLRGRGLPAMHMAVNLSFRQFQDSQLLPTLERLIAERGVEAHWLEFELTETAVMRRREPVQQTMHGLARLGVRFSLDDFGTGFSSFVHLNSLPITLLKIDKSFVAGMRERAENRQLVRAMINLAHNLDLQVVAEGVEDEEQLALLQQYGCDQAQGYLISRPQPLPELLRFLLQGQRQALLGALPR
ncbi:EAL domain protein [compost metagenome]